MFNDSSLSAFIFGIICSVSLPIGALTILFWKPKEKIISALMAFGGGALLAALTLDLVGESLKRGGFFSLAFGAVFGGVLFVLLDSLLNTQGGFLRKPAVTDAYLKKVKIKKFNELFKKLSYVSLFQNLPPEEIYNIVPIINEKIYPAKTVIMEQGKIGDSLLIIEYGKVNVTNKKTGKLISVLSKNDIVGEMALVTGEKRSADVTAGIETKGWVIYKDDFNRVIKNSSKLAEAFKKIVEMRIDDLVKKKTLDKNKADKWLKNASKNIDEGILKPTEQEIQQAAEEHHGAPLAIWLGNLLDGIPESLVIGASMIHSSLSLSLVAGLFLANYPEALSSSSGMHKQKYTFLRIILMWSSLMVITGIGAFFGSIFFQKAPDWLFSFIEGIAAGAMLTMISQTMLPEAYNKGGWITGLSTLTGFLVAIFFKTFE